MELKRMSVQERIVLIERKVQLLGRIILVGLGILLIKRVMPIEMGMRVVLICCQWVVIWFGM